MRKTCFFIGHRDAPDTIYPGLLAEVERHITELGVGEFIVGHYGRFDSLAARAVKESKVRYPEVELTLLLPYHPAKKPVQKPEGLSRKALTACSIPLEWRKCPIGQPSWRQTDTL